MKSEKDDRKSKRQRAIKLTMKEILEVPSQKEDLAKAEPSHVLQISKGKSEVKSVKGKNKKSMMQLIAQTPKIEVSIGSNEIMEINKQHEALRVILLAEHFHEEYMNQLIQFYGADQTENAQYLQQLVTQFKATLSQEFQNLKNNRLQYTNADNLVFKAPDRDEFEKLKSRNISMQVQELVQDFEGKNNFSEIVKEKYSDRLRDTQELIGELSEMVDEKVIQQELNSVIEDECRVNQEEICRKQQKAKESLVQALRQLQVIKKEESMMNEMQRLEEVQRTIARTRQKYSRWNGFDAIFFNPQHIFEG